MHVWLVEDDELVAIPFTMWIERLGHQVTSYTRAADALAAFDSLAPPDVLITDLTMPGMSGLDLITTVRKRVEDIPIILMSGYAIDPDGLGLAEPFAFMPKPVDLERLEEVIARFTGGAH